MTKRHVGQGGKAVPGSRVNARHGRPRVGRLFGGSVVCFCNVPPWCVCEHSFVWIKPALVEELDAQAARHMREVR